MTFTYAWCEIKRRKYRSLLAIFSLFIATGLFLSVWGIVRALNKGLEDIFRKSGSTMSAQIMYEALPFKRARMARNLGPIPEEVINSISVLKSVKKCTGQLHFWVWMPRQGAMSGMAGIDPEVCTDIGPLSAEIDIISGRLFQKGDKLKAILDQRFATKNKLKVGDSFKICDDDFEIIGIILPKDIRLAEAEVYIPLEDAQKIMQNEQPELVKGKVVNTILIQTDDLTNLDDLKKTVQQIIKVHCIKYGLKQFQISVFTASRIFAQAAGISILAHRTMVIISIIVLILALLLILKTAIASVDERIGEICVLKVVGWRSGDIARLIITEMLIISFLGVSLGCIAGKAMVTFWANNSNTDIPAALNPFPCIPSVPMPTQVNIPHVPLWDFMTGTFFVVCFVSVISGFIAAKFAARINPIEGLKRRMTL